MRNREYNEEKRYNKLLDEQLVLLNICTIEETRVIVSRDEKEFILVLFNECLPHRQLHSKYTPIIRECINEILSLYSNKVIEIGRWIRITNRSGHEYYKALKKLSREYLPTIKAVWDIKIKENEIITKWREYELKKTDSEYYIIKLNELIQRLKETTGKINIKKIYVDIDAIDRLKTKVKALEKKRNQWIDEAIKEGHIYIENHLLGHANINSIQYLQRMDLVLSLYETWRHVVHKVYTKPKYFQMVLDELIQHQLTKGESNIEQFYKDIDAIYKHNQKMVNNCLIDAKNIHLNKIIDIILIITSVTPIYSYRKQKEAKWFEFKTPSKAKINIINHLTDSLIQCLKYNRNCIVNPKVLYETMLKELKSMSELISLKKHGKKSKLSLVLDECYSSLKQISFSSTIKEIDDYLFIYNIIISIKEKNYAVLKEILEDKEIALNIVDNKNGIAIESFLLKVLSDSLESKDSKTFFNLVSYFQDRYIRRLINIKNSNHTLLDIAIKTQNKKVIDWLLQHGALDKQKSYSQLTENAFKPATETKISATSINKSDEKNITYYSKKNPTEQKMFQDQFYKLLDLYARWGAKNDCLNQYITYKVGNEKEKLSVINGIDNLKKKFFDESYSGMEPNEYFNEIKLKLEQILFSLSNENIPKDKRKKEFIYLCAHFSMCSPGIFSHIQDAYNSLSFNQSVDNWLADCRTNLIHEYADFHNAKKKISVGDSNHSFIAYAAYAIKQGWNPRFSSTKVQDPHKVVAKVGKEDEENFHHFFEENYNMNKIRQNIQTNLVDTLNTLCDQYNYKLNDWNTIQDNKKSPEENKKLKTDYNKFLTNLNIIMEALAVKVNTDDWCELNQDNTLFCIDIKILVDLLCADRVSPNVYYDDELDAYVDLIPDAWLENKDQKEFNFSHWKWVSSKHFATILLNILNIIQSPFVNTLFSHLPHIELLEIVREPYTYNNWLNKINSQKQREFIKLIMDDFTDFDKLDKDGNTAAHLAAMYHRPGLMEVLIEKKINVTKPNKKGLSPLDIAKQYGHDTIKELLTQNGSTEQDQKTSLSNTPQSLFFTKPNTDTLSMQLGCDKVINADMKKIYSHFVDSPDPRRQDQGEKLIEIYQEIEKLLDQANNLNYIHEISLDSLHLLNVKIAKMLNTFGQEQSDMLDNIWHNKLSMINKYSTHIQTCIIQSQPQQPEEDKTINQQPSARLG